MINRDQQQNQNQSQQAATEYGMVDGVNFAGINSIDEAYKQLLGRDPDAEGLSYWQNQNLGRNDLISSIYNSDEGKAYRASNPFVLQSKYPGIADISEAYQTLLGRAAEPDGLAYWSAKPFNDALAGIYGSLEGQNYRKSDPYRTYWTSPFTTGTTNTTTNTNTNGATGSTFGYDVIDGQQVPWSMGDPRWGNNIERESSAALPSPGMQIPSIPQIPQPYGYDIVDGQSVPWGMGDRRFRDNLPPGSGLI